DVGLEGDVAIVADVDGPVQQQDRNRLGQIDIVCPGGGDRGLDAGAVPVVRVVEQQLDQFEGAFDTDAAGAERALALAEQLLVRRVVQIDGVRIGKADGDLAERTIGAGVLAQHDRAGAVPVDPGGVQFAASRIVNPDLVVAQIVEALAQLRQHILSENRRRDRPGRIEGDVGYFGTKDGCGPVGFAHLHGGLPDRFAVLVIGDAVTGDIDQHKGAVEGLQGPAPALQVDPDLIDAFL